MAAHCRKITETRCEQLVPELEADATPSPIAVILIGGMLILAIIGGGLVLASMFVNIAGLLPFGATYNWVAWILLGISLVPLASLLALFYLVWVLVVVAKRPGHDSFYGHPSASSSSITTSLVSRAAVAAISVKIATAKVSVQRVTSR